MAISSELGEVVPTPRAEHEWRVTNPVYEVVEDFAEVVGCINVVLPDTGKIATEFGELRLRYRLDEAIELTSMR